MALWLSWHLDFGLPASKSVREYISVILSHYKMFQTSLYLANFSSSCSLPRHSTQATLASFLVLKTLPPPGLASSQDGPASGLCRYHSLCGKGSLPKNLQGCSLNLPSGLCLSSLIGKAPPNYPSASLSPPHTPYSPSTALFFSIILKLT